MTDELETPPVEAPPVDEAPVIEAPVVETPPVDDASLMSDDDGVSGDDLPQGKWPTDWKQRFAGEDDKMMKWADRQGSAEAALKAGYNAQEKLRAGAHKGPEPLADDASDEDKAAYREANGVPKTAADYNLQLADGMTVGEDDRPYVDKMLQEFHSMNMPDAEASKVLNGYFAMREEQIADQITFDNSVRSETVETLREEYGPEYKANFNKSLAFMKSQFGDEFAEEIMSARVEGGARLGDTYDFNSQILQLANTINPSITVVPNSSNPSKAIGDELAELSKDIGSPEWFNSPEKQARYQELTNAKEHYK